MLFSAYFLHFMFDKGLIATAYSCIIANGDHLATKVFIGKLPATMRGVVDHSVEHGAIMKKGYE